MLNFFNLTGIMTRIEADLSGFDSMQRQGFFLPHRVQRGTESATTFYPMDIGAFFPWESRAWGVGRGASVKNAWRYSSIPNTSS
jgi:hypothetical protein